MARIQQALGADSPVKRPLFVVAWASRSSATFGAFLFCFRIRCLIMKGLKDFFQFVSAAWHQYPQSSPLSEWFQVRFDDAVITWM